MGRPRIYTDEEVRERARKYKRKYRRRLGMKPHKQPGISNMEIRLQASRDVTQEAGEDKFFTMNYLLREAELMRSLEYDFIYYSI